MFFFLKYSFDQEFVILEINQSLLIYNQEQKSLDYQINLNKMKISFNKIEFI